MQVNFVLLFLLPLQHLKLLRLFWSQAYAIKCVKKANFWCTQRTRHVLSTCKNISVYKLNFKTKVIDNIPKKILHTMSLVQPNSDWKGEASESSVLFPFSVSKLRFMNWSENLSFLSHKSKALSMIGINNQNDLLIAAFKLNILLEIFPVALHFIY